MTFHPSCFSAPCQFLILCFSKGCDGNTRTASYFVDESFFVLIYNDCDSFLLRCRNVRRNPAGRPLPEATC